MLISIVQVKSYKSDFEDERRDREAAHSKLADLEKEVASHRELKKKYDKLEREMKASVASVKKLLRDAMESKEETEKLRGELQTKTEECDHLNDKVTVSCVLVMIIHNVIYLQWNPSIRTPLK